MSLCFNSWLLFMFFVCLNQYAVKAQTSLAPLSRFRGSHITTEHAHQCCRFQSYAKTVPSRMKLTSRKWQSCEPHSWDPRQRTTWSQRIKHVYNYIKKTLVLYVVHDLYVLTNTFIIMLFSCYLSLFMVCKEFQFDKRNLPLRTFTENKHQLTFWLFSPWHSKNVKCTSSTWYLCQSSSLTFDFEYHFAFEHVPQNFCLM